MFAYKLKNRFGLSSKIAFLTLILLSFVSSAGYAQGTDAEGAADIKSHIEGLVKQQTEIQKLAGNTYEWEGDVTVEPSGSYYAVTLPYLKVTQIDGRKLDIGMIAINTAPAQEEGMWKMAIAVPTPIKIYDKLGALESTISIGKQRLNGLWISQAKQFLKLNGAMEDIKVTDSQDNVIFQMPDSYIKYNFDIVAENIWDGDYKIGANNISFTMPGENVSGTIGNIFMDGSIEGFNMGKVGDFQSKMENAATGMSAQDMANANNPDITENLQMVGEAMFGYLSDFGKSSTGAFGIKDVSFDMPSPQDPTETVSFQMKEMSFSMDMMDMDTDKSQIGFGIALLGTDLSSTAPAADDPLEKFGAYLPNNFAIKFKVADFPYKKLMSSVGDSFASIMALSPNASDTEASAAMAQNLPDLNKLMMDSGSRLMLEDSYISSDLYKINLGMDMQVAPSSPFKVKGNAIATIEGMEDVIAQMQQDAKNPNDPSFAAQMQGALGMIPMVQMMGNQKEENGKNVYVYDFALQEDGRMMLNGADLSQMQNAMQGGQPPQ